MDLGFRLAPLRPPSSPGLTSSALTSLSSLVFRRHACAFLQLPHFLPCKGPICSPIAHPSCCGLLRGPDLLLGHVSPATSGSQVSALRASFTLAKSFPTAATIPSRLHLRSPAPSGAWLSALSPSSTMPITSYNLPSRAPQPLLLPRNLPQFIQLRWLVPMPLLGLASAMSSGGSG